MRKSVFGRQLKRDTNERKALFKGLISSLILSGRIKTTEQKAKAIKGDVDKIITKAKKGEAARRLLQSYIATDAVKKVISEIAPRFEKRQGGYTRIIRLGRRFSDNASMVLLEWTASNAAGSEAQKKTGIQKETKTPRVNPPANPDVAAAGEAEKMNASITGKKIAKGKKGTSNKKPASTKTKK